MHAVRSPPWGLVLLTMALVCLLASLARANLEVSPVQVYLSSSSPSTIVAMRNGGQVERRYQLSVSAWGERPDGQMELGATRDISFFPRLLSLRPGESRNLRLGALTPFGATEKTYRLFIEELPSAPQASGTQIQMLTRLGIPIFLAPAREVRKLQLFAPEARGAEVTLRVRNTGTVHVRPIDVRLEAMSDKGERLLNHPFQAWYVLAGQERHYRLRLPAEHCAAVRSVVARVSLPGGEVLQEVLQTPRGACGS